MGLVEFTPEAGVMIVFSLLLLGGCIWALVAARDYVLAVRTGEKPPASLVWRTVLPAVAITAVAVAMYLYAVAVT